MMRSRQHYLTLIHRNRNRSTHNLNPTNFQYIIQLQNVQILSGNRKTGRENCCGFSLFENFNVVHPHTKQFHPSVHPHPSEYSTCDKFIIIPFNLHYILLISRSRKRGAARMPGGIGISTDRIF